METVVGWANIESRMLRHPTPALERKVARFDLLLQLGWKRGQFHGQRGPDLVAVTMTVEARSFFSGFGGGFNQMAANPQHFQMMQQQQQVAQAQFALMQQQGGVARYPMMPQAAAVPMMQQQQQQAMMMQQGQMFPANQNQVSWMIPD